MSATSRVAPRKGLIVALLIAVVCSAILVAWRWQNTKGQGSPAHPSGTEIVRRSDAPGEPRPGRPSPLAEKSPGNSPRVDNSVVAGNAVVAPNGTPWVITIECVNIAGKPWSGLRLACEVSSTDENANGSGYYAKSLLQTDADGRANVQGQAGLQLSCLLQDPAFFAAPWQAPFSESERVVRMVVESTATVRVRAQYDDGQPVTYMGSFRYNRGGDYSETFGLDQNGAAVVSRVPIREDLHCLIFGQKRPGYGKVDVTFRRDQVESGMELLVVVPKASDIGGLVVRFGKVALPSGSVALLKREKGASEFKQVAPGAMAVSWPLLSPSIKYQVTIVGPKAWRSDWLTIQGGEVLQVDATLGQSGAVHIRILDEGGHPVQGAGLAISDGGYMVFLGNGMPVTATGSMSGDAGVVSLAGLPVGESVLQVEARGFEPKTITVNVEAGRDLDLGDMTLAKATGSIRVKVTGALAGAKYRVAIAQPAGPPVYPIVDCAEDATILSQIPLRAYVVCVFPAAGGRVVKELVTLDSAHADADAVLDVSSLGG